MALHGTYWDSVEMGRTHGKGAMEPHPGRGHPGPYN